MSDLRSSFVVPSPVTSLSITIQGQVVRSIFFGRRTDRLPSTDYERHVAAELEEYFAGSRKTFTLAVRADGSAFEQRVWAALLDIPYGQIATYGDIARALGEPGASRAVGAANGRNPIPIIIPCHRVVAANGKLGGFGGGIELKKKLLDLEAVNSPLLR